MRVMGVDYGRERVGVALSDPLGKLATPLVVVKARDRDWALAELRRLAERHEAQALVVGLALNMDGSEGPAAAACREFGEILRKKTRLPVFYEDERLSTETARERLLGQGRDLQDIDRYAAAVVLQSWLDANPTAGT